MSKYLTQEDAFTKCKKEGRFIIMEDVDRERIKSTLIIANADVESAMIIKNSIAKQSKQWSSVYKLYYDALHELTESFLYLENFA